MAVGERGNDNGVKELIKTATALGNTTIDLSRKNLTEIPPEVLQLHQLEFLYVEGNYLTTIPADLFEKLPNLKWLDLRNNHLTEFPAAIGSHKAIRNLLLEGNDLKELPLELGFAKLSGLNIASNPLEMPPSSVIEKGTQEILKFLRENYSKMEDSSKQTLDLRTASASSSEEDLFDSNDIAVAHHYEEKAPIKEDGVNIERVRLPPIFQAAAERPRTRTVEDPYSILRGQKSTRFEPKPKRNIQVSEPEMRLKSPQRKIHEAPRRNHSPQRNHTISPDERHPRGYSNHAKFKKYSDSALRISVDLTDVNGDEEKAEKLRKRRKPRRQSPSKNVVHSSKKQENHGSVALSYDNKMTDLSENKILANKCEELKEVTVKTNDMKVTEANIPRGAATDAAPKFPGATTGFNLKEGDYVAIKVPPKLYIKGQPCLGKITTMADNIGLLTVHYYTGTYDGYWRPMMSRTSPYLRKVPLSNIICKFKLSSDGRMSPITRAKVKNTVDGE